MWTSKADIPADFWGAQILQSSVLRWFFYFFLRLKMIKLHLGTKLTGYSFNEMIYCTYCKHWRYNIQLTNSSPQEMVPPYLATSPIMTEGAALMEYQLGKSRLGEPITGSSIQSLGPSLACGDNGMTKKRRKRRRKSKVDSVKREDNGDSEEEDMFPIDMSSDEDTDTACRLVLRMFHCDPLGGCKCW